MNDPPDVRRFAKLAVLLHGRLLQAPQVPTYWNLLDNAWHNVEREYRRLRLANSKGLRCAEAEQHELLKTNLRYLQQDLATVTTHLEVPPAPRVAKPREIPDDLLALHKEFDEVAYDAKRELLSVTTPSITLEGLYLGPFRIELDLRRLLPQPDYFVRAEDPQCPDGNDSVTHPHVQDGSLCEGEGTMPIRAAIRSGYLLDFFLIVNQLLHTYNPSSPFVPIARWPLAPSRFRSTRFVVLVQCDLRALPVNALC